jgi:hypothetical protein
VSVTLQRLVQEWIEEAERIRSRYRDESLAALCEAHARELAAALRTSLDEEVTLSRAAELSGYSRSHLRRLMDQGVIPNVGEPGSPRLRVGDLPFRPRRMTADRAVHARRGAPDNRQVTRVVGHCRPT